VSEIVELLLRETAVITAPGGGGTTVVVPQPALEIVEVAEQGPAGPPGADGAVGPPGPPGGASYTHNQMVPAADWTITHNLARFP